MTNSTNEQNELAAVQVDVVVPFFNPPDHWARSFYEQATIVCELFDPVQINWIFVNDGSTHRIDPKDINFLKEALPSVSWLTYEQNQGKGFAVRYGMEKTSTEIVAFTDIDLPYNAESMMNMFRTVKNKKVDIVIGHRSGEYYQKISGSRFIISKLFQFFIGLIMRVKYSDTQSGLKFFSERGKSVLLSTNINSYLFDLELVKKATREGVSISSIELTTRPDFRLQPKSATHLLRELQSFIKILFS